MAREVATGLLLAESQHTFFFDIINNSMNFFTELELQQILSDALAEMECLFHR